MQTGRVSKSIKGSYMPAEITRDIPIEHEKNIFGSFDKYLKKIERALEVDITEHNGTVRITSEGPAVNAERAASVLDGLLSLSEQSGTIAEQQVDYILSLSMEGHGHEKEMIEIDRDIICRSITGRPIKPKTFGQKNYVDLIRSKMITFGVGPAGTGKTYLAMALAIKAFKDQEVQRIILTRPAIEAGEKLGFLPGDLQQKIDPYLRPLYDALYSIMGADSFVARLTTEAKKAGKKHIISSAFEHHAVLHTLNKLKKQGFAL